jgi:beta-lactamase class A
MNDAAVGTAIEAMVAEYEGTIGVSARDLAGGRRFDLNEGEQFAAASVIKVAILLELFAQAEEGRVALEEQLGVVEAEKVGGSGILKEMREGHPFTLEELARLMIVISDNVASNLLIDRLTTDAINARLQSLGMTRTVLGRKFYDYGARDRGLDNWAAPADLAGLMVLLERRELVSAAASEAMLAIMLRQQVSNKIPRLLPNGTLVAHKTGTINNASHDAGIIYAPAGPLALAVLTKDLTELQAEAAISRIARALYDAWGGDAED